MSQYTFPEDRTGKMPSNRIVGERHKVTFSVNNDFKYIIPRNGPFYRDGLVVKSLNLVNNQTTTLLEGVDYYLGYKFVSASRGLNADVYGCIVLMDSLLSSDIITDYQNIGGKWVVDLKYLAEQMAKYLKNPRTITWEQITDIKEYFNPKPHAIDAQNLMFYDDLLKSVSSIKDAVKEAALKKANDPLNNPIPTTTKEDIGLENVENLPVAKNRAQLTSPIPHYVVNTAIIEYITNEVLAVMEEHIKDEANPHGIADKLDKKVDVTKYTEDMSEKLSKSEKAADAALLEGKSIEQIKSDFISALPPPTLGDEDKTRIKAEIKEALTIELNTSRGDLVNRLATIEARMANLPDNTGSSLTNEEIAEAIEKGTIKYLNANNGIIDAGTLGGKSLSEIQLLYDASVNNSLFSFGLDLSNIKERLNVLESNSAPTVEVDVDAIVAEVKSVLEAEEDTKNDDWVKEVVKNNIDDILEEVDLSSKVDITKEEIDDIKSQSLAATTTATATSLDVDFLTEIMTSIGTYDHDEINSVLNQIDAMLGE